MTADSARTARFPALDPEPPPRSRQSRALRVGLGLLVVVVAIGGVRWAALAVRASPASPVKSAHILAYSHATASLSITSVGSGATTSYAAIGPVDSGLLATPDGQTLISSSGRTVTLKAGRPVSTSTRYFDALTNSGLVEDLADAGRYLVVSTGEGDGTVELVSTDSAAAHTLGTGGTVAGDPTKPALYVAVPGGDALPIGDGFYESPDRTIEHRGIGIATTVLTTAAAAIAQLHWPAATPVTLAPVPNPTGTLVAVVTSAFVTPAAAAAASAPDQAVTELPDGVAVYTTDGALVGVRPAIGPHSVTWAPDGRTLLYADTATGRVVAWTPLTNASTSITLPAGIAALGECAWSPDHVHAMCSGITSGPDAAIAAWCLVDLRARTAETFPHSTEPVLWETG